MCPFAVYAKRQSGLVNPDYAKALEGLPQFIRDDGTVVDKGKILVGFFFLENSGEPLSRYSAADVELVVRDLMISDELFVDEVLTAVQQRMETKGGMPYGIYTIVVIVLGFPVGVPSNKLESWARDVSSVYHRLVFSESLNF